MRTWYADQKLSQKKSIGMNREVLTEWKLQYLASTRHAAISTPNFEVQKYECCNRYLIANDAKYLSRIMKDTVLVYANRKPESEISFLTNLSINRRISRG